MDASKQTVGGSYYCRDKRKFGGPGKKKKACEKRNLMLCTPKVMLLVMLLCHEK